MKMLQKRVAIFLCMLMAITTVAAYLPGTQETAEAASKWSYRLTGSYYGFFSNPIDLEQNLIWFVVEEGNDELYLSDFLMAYKRSDSAYYGFTGSKISGAKYESENTDILTVDSETGKINAQMAGTAQVKITWKKQTLYGAIKVISSSDMEEYKTANKITISYAKKILKACGDELTATGALKAQKLMFQRAEEATEGENWIAKRVDTWTDEESGYSRSICESIVYSMDAVNAKKKLTEVRTYLGERNPFATTGSYKFEISSLSGSGKTVTATLAKAVTKDQMAGAKFSSWDLSKMSGKNYSFDIALRDTKTNKFIAGTATIKTGSKKVTIECKKSLKKGREYELMAKDYSNLNITDWSGKKAKELREDWIHNGKSTFKAK
jgi:hypothetical protein